ncbi:MAG: portal protein [Candidatus Pacearchaeota archaeon]|jgi:hypothetical protein|nr:portal protein [Clostridia bacterium]
MAGFLNRQVDGTTVAGWSISKSIKRLASLGMNYEDMIIQQSKAVGATEAMMGNQGFMPEDFLYSLALADIGQKKFIAYFDKGYPQRRDYLRNFAMNGEIDFMIETITDEAIVYDDRNFFCKPDLQNLRRILKDDVQDEIINYIWGAFNKIYYAHHFVEGQDAWSFFKQFLIDGFLAFEIIYDPESKNIVGFKELDAGSLRPGISKDENGKLQKIWVQYEDIPTMKRELYDSQIIYISYAKGNFSNRTSYVERLIRSFNLLRILENSRTIWNVMNASFRIKMIVPIGTKSPQKAKESLAEMMAIYKEDINLDMDSGELSVNGRPSMQFYKNYLFPSKAGEQPEIDVMQTAGTDLSDTEALRYFYDKLKSDSKIPFERFDNEGGGGSWGMDAGGMSREEIRFSKFITRLRSIFQEIIIKPVILQVQLKYPFLQNDDMFKSALGLDYEEENLFKEMKMMDVQSKRVEFVTNMLGLMVNEKDDSGMDSQVPFFDAMFLAEKYLKMSQSDMEQNQKYINRRKLGLDPRTGKPLPKKKQEGDSGGGDSGGGVDIPGL